MLHVIRPTQIGLPQSLLCGKEEQPPITAMVATATEHQGELRRERRTRGRLLCALEQRTVPCAKRNNKNIKPHAATHRGRFLVPCTRNRPHVIRWGANRAPTKPALWERGATADKSDGCDSNRAARRVATTSPCNSLFFARVFKKFHMKHTTKQRVLSIFLWKNGRYRQ